MSTGKRRGRFPKLRERELEILRAVVVEHPGATFAQYNAMLAARTGVSVSMCTLGSTLRRNGIKRTVLTMPARHAEKNRADNSSMPSGARRRKGPPRGSEDEARYNTALTDTEWTLVSEIFERDGGLGRPPKYSRRWMVDACCYVVRNGYAWRSLPKSFPPWSGVYKVFQRWNAEGRFDEMHERLRRRWNERAEHDDDRSASAQADSSSRTALRRGDDRSINLAKRHTAHQARARSDKMQTKFNTASERAVQEDWLGATAVR